MTFASRAALAAAASSFALAWGAAHAQSLSFPTPNVTNAAGDVSVSVGGQIFTNHGLQGVGRIPATTRDFNGESFGAFSALAMDLSTWRRNANGGYSGTLYSMPDRGPNGVGPFPGTTAFQNRLEVLGVTFAPYTASSATTPTQMGLALTGGFFLKDSTGVTFTGKDPGTGTVTRNGVAYPMPASGEGAGHISMDSEGLARLNDGSFYVSDEYAAGLYYFNAQGTQAGGIQAPPALLPRTGGVINFNGDAAPATGRRNNQGLEAVTVTPDQSRLITVLQSATIQDNPLDQAQNRNNTRILVYDITATRTPTTPIGDFVLQLPIFRNSGNGATPDTTAAQSEALALNNHQLLVLSRDGNGRGNSATRPEVFRSVLLVDLNGATNLAGTSFDQGTTPIVTGGACSAATDARGCLLPSITPVSVSQLLNIINPTQLGRFGLNTNTAPSNINSVSEKLEGMTLVPVLEENAPQDFYLLIGNDNDFETSNGAINGQSYDASLSGPGGTGNNEPTILVYRLTLPTYVDPQALLFMQAATPVSLALTGETAAAFGEMVSGPAMEQLSSARSAALLEEEHPFGRGVSVWGSANWRRIGLGGEAESFSADGTAGVIGVDYGFGQARIGASLGYQRLDGDFGGGFSLKASGWGVGGYGAWVGPQGLYAQVSGGALFDLRLRDITRPASYGLTAVGQANARSASLAGEIGWSARLGQLRVGPYVEAAWNHAKVDGYTEHGAAVGNAVIPGQSFDRTSYGGGVELLARLGGLRPSLRLGYVGVGGDGPRDYLVSLAAAQDPSATQTVRTPEGEGPYARLAGGVEGDALGLSWRLSAEGRIHRRSSDVSVAFGLAKAF